MKIIDVPQLSLAWLEARRGIPTASQFGRILTPKTMKLAAAADEYIAELVGEQMSKLPLLDKAMNGAMRQGVEFEAEARDYYRLERGVEVRQVGLCLTDDGRFGCSPDGLVEALLDCPMCRNKPFTADGSVCNGCDGRSSDGGLELKVPQGKTQVGYLLAGTLPDEYRAQVHGSMIVTGREWWDFLSYSPGLPPLLIRVTPDEYTAKLKDALEQFYARLTEVRQKIEGMQ